MQTRHFPSLVLSFLWKKLFDQITYKTPFSPNIIWNYRSQCDRTVWQPWKKDIVTVLTVLTKSSFLIFFFLHIKWKCCLTHRVIASSPEKQNVCVMCECVCVCVNVFVYTYRDWARYMEGWINFKESGWGIVRVTGLKFSGQAAWLEILAEIDVAVLSPKGV